MEQLREGTITRMFHLKQEPCFVHVPNKPNGFAILYLGDQGQRVDEDHTFWWENPNRKEILRGLLDQGYVLFTSRLFMDHWGNDRSIELLDHLYHKVVRTEIINSRIHVLAEGMGALAALKWGSKSNQYIRSFVFLSPCIDLNEYYKKESENRVGKQRIRKQIAKAYNMEKEDLDEIEKQEETIFEDYNEWISTIPSILFQDPKDGSYPVESHGRKWESKLQEEDTAVIIKFIFKEDYHTLPQKMKEFLREWEKD
ncbi:hypothetical protein RZN22_02910 [Bacillaceae bacterium S4-13-58]